MAFPYVRYTKYMQEIIGIGMKECLSLPGFGWKELNSLREEDVGSIFTYSDKYMRLFVRQSIKGGRVCADSHYYYSKSSDNISKCLSKEFK